MDETTEEVNLSNVIMSHGHGFVKEQNVCELCGHKRGMKKRCQHSGCRQWGQANKPSHVHLTCGRQAGFEVNTREAKDGTFQFFVHCFKHSRCEDAFRARIEDLIEIEKFRVGKRFDMKDAKTMSISHASRLLNSAIIVLQNLGWAWRWAEWWVENGSNWEPLIEEGQDEKKMTKQQLKIIESTPESRCKDARACRLVAFSAALRNRAYDSEVEGPTKMLDRALRALLATKSLVGPLNKAEIEHCAQWLGIAYRSKSRLLGFGEDKISINRSFRFSVNSDDNSAKFELGNRRLPGKQVLPEGQFFETDFHDIDDFLKPETLDDGSIYCRPRKNKGNATKQKAAGKKPFQPKVEDVTKARSPRKRAVERKERQKSTDKPLQNLIVGKNGTAEGSTVPQSVQRKDGEKANYKKRQGPGRPPKSPKKQKVENKVSSSERREKRKVSAMELMSPEPPSMIRRTRSKNESRSPRKSLESVLVRDQSGEIVHNGEVSSPRRTRRRSAPVRFYAERSDEEYEESSVGSSSQNQRKWKRVLRTTEKQPKTESLVEPTKTRSSDADAVHPVESSSRGSGRKGSIERKRKQVSNGQNESEKPNEQDSTSVGKELRNGKSRANMMTRKKSEERDTCKTQNVLASNFRVPRKRQRNVSADNEEHNKEENSRILRRGRSRGRNREIT